MATPEERMLERMGPASIPRQPSETEAANIAFDKAVQKAASTPGLRDESSFGFLAEAYEHQMMTIDEVKGAAEGLGEAGKNMVLAMPSAFLGTSADLMAMTVSLGYNAIRMAQGDDFAWSEDFSDVPATSDFYGEMLGADVSDFAFIGGALAITNPAKYTKFVNKTLQAAKALKGGRKAAVLKLENAKALDQEGLSREEIWQQTGWWKSKDKGWRFAISDADAAINSKELGRLSRMRESFDPGWTEGEVRQVTLRLDQILTHDAMYEMYPEVGGILTTVPVRKVEGGFKLANRSERSAWYSPSLNQIKVNNTQKIRETLLHEAQHAIQKIEGFSEGTSLKALTDDITNYQVSHVLLDVHNNPLDYADIDHEGLEFIIRRMVGERKSDGQVKSLVRDVYEMSRGTAQLSNDHLDELKGLQEASGRNALRWLNQVGNDQAIEELSPEMVDMYANMAYHMHLGEAEARLVESLSKVAQRDLDRVSQDPHRLMYWLDKSRYKKVDPQGVARVEPMNPSVAEEATIAGTPAAKAESIEDAYIKPAYLLTKDKVRVEYLKNPTRTELQKWAKKRDTSNIRLFKKDDEVFMWDANEALHEDMIPEFGYRMGDVMKGPDTDVFTVEEALFYMND